MTVLTDTLAATAAWLASGTILANTVLALTIACLAVWLLVLVAGTDATPLQTCPCGWRSRRRDSESERSWRLRQDAHWAACPALERTPVGRAA